MPKGSARVKIIQKNTDLMDVVNSVMGQGGESLKIVFPKYKEIITTINKYIKFLTFLRDSNIFENLPQQKAHVVNYVNSIKMPTYEPELNKYTTNSLGLEYINYTEVTKQDADVIIDNYKKLKASAIYASIIKTHSNLKQVEQYISSKNDKFLIEISTNSFEPISGLILDFKFLYNAEQWRPFIMSYLNNILIVSGRLVELHNQPDIDIDDMIEIVRANLNTLKKQLPRNDDAFNEILKSMELLKTNFGEYYKDFTATNNPSLIMESFIKDVAKKGESSGVAASPKIAIQFKNIINHYRKLMAARGNDPKVNTIFKYLDENIAEYEKEIEEVDTEKIFSDLR